jgi:hypothetical protein
MRMPSVKAKRELWSQWVELRYPFDSKWERHLKTRQPHQRPPMGHADELNDLRGMRDRSQAAMFAIFWANANRLAADSLQRGDYAPMHRDVPASKSELDPDSMMLHYEQRELGLGL